MADPTPPLNQTAPDTLLTPVPKPFEPGRSKQTEVAAELQRTWNKQREEDQERNERIALIYERNAQIQERMLPAQERIAYFNDRASERDLEKFKLQAPHLARWNQLQIEYYEKEHKRIADTFDTMYRQTMWASGMHWITFLLGVGLIVVSVAAYLVQPEPNNPLIVAFFGCGALSMLAFFLRDPAQRLQYAGGKLIQLQMAMRYHLQEMQYWNTYFTGKTAGGETVVATCSSTERYA
jgi:hypothetical protein